jgi:hypothetical protein
VHLNRGLLELHRLQVAIKLPIEKRPNSVQSVVISEYKSRLWRLSLFRRDGLFRQVLPGHSGLLNPRW